MDRLFTSSRIVSLLMSGLIGIIILTFTTGVDSLDGQSKYLFIALGYPLWAITKMIYWTSRTKQLIELYKTDDISYREIINMLKKINPDKAEDIEHAIVISMLRTISKEKVESVEESISNEKIKPVEEYIFNNDRFDNNFLNAYNSV